ncbi:porin [Bosea sp. PAMC 26642]|uniref:porin n=1 Tax=Bosea sp. (strain PAMC 26642) TaxID=1792307 RepID=UPI00077055BA|nr:porin [Bosea sp. PAMC 26642]AMJ59290.1 hypothetical protein AXW83_02325 [Bosea sp. PAMC 26642]
MRPFATALGLLLVATAPGAAQSIGEPLPGRGAPRTNPKPAQATQAARPCPAYGPGFVRVEGSSLCVRVGGAVRVEYGKSSHNGYGSSAGGAVRVESRGETSLGPVRSFVQMRGQVDRGLESSPFR